MTAFLHFAAKRYSHILCTHSRRNDILCKKGKLFLYPIKDHNYVFGVEV